VTRTGLETLAAMDEVAHIHALDRCREETVQGRRVLQAPAVNAMGYTGSGVGVAILDSGVEYSHVCLGWHPGFPNARVVAGRYVVPRTVPGKGGREMVRDLSGHGTACAVIAAGEKLSFFRKLGLARSDDYDGGVAPEAGVYAVQLYRDNGTYRFDEIIRGLQWCADPTNHDSAHPLLVANVSLGGGRHRAEADVEQHNFFLAVDDCVEMGITVFASTGNQGYAGAVAMPAALSNVVGVGAVYDSPADQRTYTVVDGRCVPPGTGSDRGPSCACTDRDVRPGRVCCFTNLHPDMTELFAPAALACTAGAKEDELISNFGGTSAASAYAAGAAAVLQQAAREKTGRYLTPQELRDLMHRTGRRAEYPRRPHEPVLTGRLVDVERAVASFGP
jgi:subtilisin family serine protease